MARFMRRGKAKVYFLPTVASTTGAPIASEVTAGTNLTTRIADISGFMKESAKIDTPDLNSRFTSNIPGEQTVGDSTLTFYADDANTDAIKTALAEETAGYLYIMKAGSTVGQKADLFPVRVSSIGEEYSMGNDAARFAVNFAITDPPRIDVAIA